MFPIIHACLSVVLAQDLVKQIQAYFSIPLRLAADEACIQKSRAMMGCLFKVTMLSINFAFEDYVPFFIFSSLLTTTTRVIGRFIYLLAQRVYLLGARLSLLFDAFDLTEDTGSPRSLT